MNLKLCHNMGAPSISNNFCQEIEHNLIQIFCSYWIWSFYTGKYLSIVSSNSKLLVPSVSEVYLISVVRITATRLLVKQLQKQT